MIEYLLCKEFGWTITDLYEQPGNKVMRFIQIIFIKRQVEDMKNQGK